MRIHPQLNKKPLLAALALCALCVYALSSHASAYNGGRIIDNDIFRASNSMSKSQVQSFLVSKNSGLKSKKYKLSCYGAGSRERTLYTNAGAKCDVNIPASEIIYYAAKIYGISPRVVLATLQKEQSLITATNPTSWQLSQAMGYACPTSGSCSSESNFSYQIDSGTWVLRYHYERARGNNDWWTPSSGWVCGTTKNYYKPNLYPNQNVKFYDQNGVHYRTHFLTNAATSSMYCYTPHAYNNPQGLYGRPPYGTKGMYYSGSYNFVKSFVAWFGPTTKFYTPLEKPRWMQTKVSAYKKNPHLGTNVDTAFAQDFPVQIVDKIYMDGQWYLRTEYDSRYKRDKGFLLSELEELDPAYQSLDTPRWMQVKPGTAKMYLASQTNIGKTLDDHPHLFFESKFNLDGEWYLRTSYDTQLDTNQVIPISQLQEITPSFEALEHPRKLKADVATSVKNPVTEQNISSVSQGTEIYFTTKVNIGGKWYLRSQSDSNSNLTRGIPLADLGEAPVVFENFDTPRWMILATDTYKVHPMAGNKLQPLAKGTQFFFDTKVANGGQLFFRTAFDTQNGLDKAVPFSRITNIPYVPLDKPRVMTLTQTISKVIPATGQTVDSPLPLGTKIHFTTKIYVNGEWYLRSQSDTGTNLDKAISIQYLGG